MIETKSSMDRTGMRTDTQVMHVGEEVALPWDLRNWFEAAVLRQWVSEEFEALDWNNPEVIEYLSQRPGFQPKEIGRASCRERV